MADDQKGLERKRHSSKNEYQDYDQKREDSNEEQPTSITISQTSYTYPSSVIPHVNPPEIMEIGVLKPLQETPFVLTNQEKRYPFSVLDFMSKNWEASFSKSSLGAPFSESNLGAPYQENADASARLEIQYPLSSSGTPFLDETPGFSSSCETPGSPDSGTKLASAYSVSRLESLRSGKKLASPFSSATQASSYLSETQAFTYRALPYILPKHSRSHLILDPAHLPPRSELPLRPAISDPSRLHSNLEPTHSHPTQKSVRSFSPRPGPSLPPPRPDPAHSSASGEIIRDYISLPGNPESAQSPSRLEPALSHAVQELARTHPILDPARLPLRLELVLWPAISDPSGLYSNLEPTHSHPSQKSARSFSPTPGPSRPPPRPEPARPPPRPEPAHSTASVEIIKDHISLPGNPQPAQSPSWLELALSQIVQELVRTHSVLDSTHLPPSPDPALLNRLQELVLSHPILGHLSYKQEPASSDQLRLPANLEPTSSHPSQKFACSFPRPGPSQLFPRSEPVSVEFVNLLGSQEPAQLPPRQEPADSPANLELVSLPASPIPPHLTASCEDFSVKYYRKSVLEKFFPITEKYTNVFHVQKLETQSKNWPPFIRLWFTTLPHHAQELFLECPLNLQLQLPSWHTNILQKLFSLPKEEMKTAFEKPCEFIKQYFHLSNSMRRKLPLCSLNDFQEINQWLCDHQQQFYTWPSTIRQLLGEWYHSMMEYISPPFEFNSKVNCKERVTSPFSARNVAFLGSPRCGRTYFILSLQGKLSQCSEDFHEFNPTIFEREIVVDEIFQKKLRFIDADMTNFFEIYDSVKNSDLVVLCYAVDDIDSFLLAMGKWYNVARKISPKISIFLVGLKCDRRDGKTNRSLDGRPAVPRKVIKKVFCMFGIEMEFECSGFTHQNIKDVGTALESLLQ